MAGDVPGCERFPREVEFLRRRVRELESELRDSSRAVTEPKTRLEEREDNLGVSMETIPRRTDEVQKVSWEEYRTIADFTYDWEWWRQPDGEFRYVSPACERLTGYPPSAFLEDAGLLLRIVHVEDRDTTARYLERNDLRQADECEFRIVARDGEVRWIHCCSAPVIDSAGEFAGHRGSCRDITKRKRAEDMLKESEERYRSLVAATMDAVLLTVPDGQILSANEAACGMFGYSEEELVTMGRNGVVDGTDPRLLTALDERARTGQFRGELTFIRKDGTRFPAEISSSLFTTERGEQRTSMVIRDITEQRRIEKRLRESEYFLQAMVDALPFHICVLDETGTIVVVNRAWREFAMANQSMYTNVCEGANYLAVCDAATGDDAQTASAFSAGIRAVMACAQESFCLEYPCHSPTEQRWFLGRVTRLSGPSPGYVVVAHENVTERKRAEKTLQENEERYRAVVEDQTEVICRFKADGTLTFANDVSCRLFGKQKDDLVGKKWWPMVVPDDLPRVEARLRALSVSQPIVENENRVLLNTGQVRWMQFVNRGFFDADGRLTEIQAVGRDVSDRKQMEEILVVQRDLAMALNDTTGLQETLRLCLNAAMSISGTDCGGVYLMDGTSGSLTLAFSAGLSASFIEASSSYQADSGNTRLVMAGVPVYGRHRDMGLRLSDAELGEGLCALAVIPVQHDGQVVGCVNVASHTIDEIPLPCRAGLETIAELVGSAISKRQTEESLNAYKGRLQLLASELAQTEDRERRRVAVYLHDHVSQSLAALRVKFAIWRSTDALPEREALLHDMGQLIEQTIQEARSLTFELSPPLLFELGLGPTLEWLGERLCQKEGIGFEFSDDGRCRRLQDDMASALYRIARELLLNAVKHAQAKCIWVSVSADNDGIRLMVKDDGIGMVPSRYEQALKGLGGTYGLFSVCERLRLLEGSLSIDSSLGKGSCITVMIPIPCSVSAPWREGGST